MTLSRSNPHAKPRWFALLVLVCIGLAFAASAVSALTTADPPSFSFVSDESGPNDLPGQKDLTAHAQASSSTAGAFWVAWKWDDTSWSGNNTGDACALFDTDGDGMVNSAICVTVGGKPLASQLRQSVTPIHTELRLSLDRGCDRDLCCRDVRLDECHREHDLRNGASSIFQRQMKIKNQMAGITIEYPSYPITSLHFDLIALSMCDYVSMADKEVHDAMGRPARKRQYRGSAWDGPGWSRRDWDWGPSIRSGGQLSDRNESADAPEHG